MPTFALKPTIFLAAVCLVQLAHGQATAEQIATVQAQYDSSEFSASYPEGFGIPLKAQALLNVVYPSGNVQLGKPYTASDVSTQPTISITPLASAANNFKAPNAFTLTLADANALGNPDPQGNYRHFLENGLTFGDASSNDTQAANSGSGTVVTSYAGPGPLANEGPHRYCWMLFAQPSGFQAPSNLSTAGVGPGHWYVNGYVSGSGLGDLVAASFFTVENGHASFTIKPTTAASTGVTTGPAKATPAPNASTSSTNANAKNQAHGAQAGMGELVKSLVMGSGILFIGILLVQ